MEGYEDDPEYQAWINSCCEKCTCDHKPCDGIMAGGLCDEINRHDHDDFAEDEEDSYFSQ